MAVIKTIDALGGIEIDVQDDEWEYVNAYMYETTEISEAYLDHYSPFLEGPGLQTLDGLQATAYCGSVIRRAATLSVPNAREWSSARS